MILIQIIKNVDLEELRELGSGTYGTVYHGKWRGSDVAIKRIKKSCFAGRSSEQERLVGSQILSFLVHFSFETSSDAYIWEWERIGSCHVMPLPFFIIVHVLLLSRGGFVYVV